MGQSLKHPRFTPLMHVAIVDRTLPFFEGVLAVSGFLLPMETRGRAGGQEGTRRRRDER